MKGIEKKDCDLTPTRRQWAQGIILCRHHGRLKPRDAHTDFHLENKENASLVRNTTNKMKYSIRMMHSKASRSKLKGKDNIKKSPPASLFTGPVWPIMAHYIAADRLLIRILN